MALELTTREVGEVGAGIFAGSIIHVLVENFLDKYYKAAHPDNYETYSGATSVLVLGLLGIVLYFMAGRGMIGKTLGGIGMGIALGEIPQFIDMVRVNFSVGLED